MSHTLDDLHAQPHDQQDHRGAGITQALVAEFDAIGADYRPPPGGACSAGMAVASRHGTVSV
jgi:hypothetical protein